MGVHLLLTSRPALLQMYSLEIPLAIDFLLLENVVRRLMKLQNCERVGRDLLLELDESYRRVFKYH